MQCGGDVCWLGGEFLLDRVDEGKDEQIGEGALETTLGDYLADRQLRARFRDACLCTIAFVSLARLSYFRIIFRTHGISPVLRR